MTNREFYNAVIEGTINEEMIEFARDAVAQLDATNEKRRAKQAERAVEKAAEKEPLRAAIFACVSDEPKTATMLIDEAGLELKPQSIPSLLKPLVEDGQIVKVDVKVKGKGTQRGYVRA
jgi:sRNA-binding protein